jgi:ATP-dependent 26S proteasome regulatory subunit
VKKLNAKPYKNNAEHLLAELALLDLFIGREIRRVRSSAKQEQEMFRGLYISDADVDRLLAEPEEPERRLAEELFRARLAECAGELARRTNACLEEGISLALPYLGHLFKLSRFEQQILLLCAAPEIDAKYERLFGYLHDDISRRRPTVGLVLGMLCPTQGERAEAMRLFSPRAPLFRTGLIKQIQQAEDTHLRRTLVPDEMVLNALLGVAGPGGEFEGCVRMYGARRPLEELRWPSRMKQELSEFVRRHLEPRTRTGRRSVVHLHGPGGTGKKTLAGALCRAAQIQMLVVDGRELLRRSMDLDGALFSVFRYGLLLQAAVYIEHFEALTGEESKFSAYQQTLARAVEEMSLITFLGAEEAWTPGDTFRGTEFLPMALPMPDVAERKKIWADLASGWPVDEGVAWNEIATQFRLTPGRMETAFQTAVTLASFQQGPEFRVSRADLYSGCYSQSNRKLTTLAQRLVPRHTWEDIILPENALAQIQEICSQLKHRQRVYQEWGFERKLVRGKGLCALFYGHSGVGKTMAVEVLAHELNLEIFKIDLSTVVSKYIGETEKNLSRIFREAEDSNSILFFDEADALFGKRSEVKDAHDRYANIEINYLLQRIEEFDGLVVLATNLRRNIDEGFFRRMQFVVELPFPDESHRYRIWKQHFPEAAPLGTDIDFDYLAKRFSLAGGHIRNVAVNAAFLAASNSGTIHMEHVIRATKREYEKIGKVCTESEFAPYQWALRDAPNKFPTAKI